MPRLIFVHGLGILAAILINVTSARANDFALGPGDVIDVSVLSRPELSRLYRVRLDGSISMHILGSMQAAGNTPAEFESSLEARLREVFEGTTSTTVEVAEYRPVVVDGHVSEPGSYPFQAGLDVAGATALAGGLYRLAGGSDISAQMRVEAEVARHAILRAQLAVSLVKRARLLAERDASAEIVVPAEAKRILRNSLRGLSDAHSALRSAREKQLSLRIDSGTASMELATTEATAYASRQELIRRQLESTLTELEAQQELSARGLARTARLLDLRLSADDYRADELEAVALEAEARQRVSEAEAGINAVIIAQERNIVEELAVLDAEILEMRAAIEQAHRFVRVFAGTSLSGETQNDGVDYRIHRRESDGVRVIEAEAETLLRPADTVQVMLGDPMRPDEVKE